MHNTYTTTSAADKDAAYDRLVELARTDQLQTPLVAQAVFEGVISKDDKAKALRLGYAQQLQDAINRLGIEHD